MRDDLTRDWFGDGEDPARYDPVRSARAGLKAQLPKRFYTTVSAELRDGQHVLLLDGKPARTKLRNLLATGAPAAAALLVEEWSAQGERIDPATMPVTRILHAAIDHVVNARQEVIDDILNYAGTDVVCYRAADPDRLVELQQQHWDPVLAHIAAAYGARFVLSEGIRYVEQTPEAIAALRQPVTALAPSPAALAALHVLTTLAGSALIALSVADGYLSADAGFDAGEVDADFEVSVWGSDDEAVARRAARLGDFRAAARLLAALAAG
ncbi:MAG: hypothetical protein FD175_860 [Beijerinckiaceae bacterium]|nr:MAG: hypothetical protein FD175_860 [Beijerinckiaceae bacterium]